MSFDPLASWVRENCDSMRPIRWNCIKLSENFTEATARATVEICLLAWKDKKRFACEVYMKNGCRADIVVPEWTYPVIEIRDSETDHSIESKTAKYNEIGLWFLDVPASLEGINKVILEEGI